MKKVAANEIKEKMDIYGDAAAKDQNEENEH